MVKHFLILFLLFSLLSQSYGQTMEFDFVKDSVEFKFNLNKNTNKHKWKAIPIKVKLPEDLSDVSPELASVKIIHSNGSIMKESALVNYKDNSSDSERERSEPEIRKKGKNFVISIPIASNRTYPERGTLFGFYLNDGNYALRVCLSAEGYSAQCKEIPLVIK